MAKKIHRQSKKKDKMGNIFAFDVDKVTVTLIYK